MRALMAVTFGAALVVAAACGGGNPEPVTPTVDSAAIRDSIRRDSIARAEAARRDSIARAQAEAANAERLRREREEAAMREITERVRTMLATRIHFDFDKSNIRPGEDTQVLEAKLSILQANSAVQIEITGHCDERGSDEYNQALGMRRATAVKQWLVNHGIAESRITVLSRGEEQPIAMGSNEDAWAQNRRDEFRITAGGQNLTMPSGMGM